MNYINGRQLYEANLSSLEYPLSLAVEVEVAPQRLVQHFSIDTKLLSIHLSKVIHTTEVNKSHDMSSCMAG